MFISRKSPGLAAITLLALVFTLVAPCTAAFAAPGDKVFDIIEIADFHGMLEDTKGNPVAAVMAKNIKDIAGGNPGRTLIVSGGDNYQGSAVSNLLRGEPVMNVFNNIGVAVSALGNHEFYWGLDTVTGSGAAGYPVICSNLFYKGDGSLVFEPYKIFVRDGVKIAIVGAVTEDLPDLVKPEQFKDYEAGSIVDNVRRAAQEARAEGAQIVIALIHAGDNYDSRTGPVFEVAGRLGGAGGVVDAVLGGHTHNVVAATAANGTPVAVAGCYGKGFIDLKIVMQEDGRLTFNTSYIDCDTSSTIPPYGYKAAAPVVDQAVSAIVDAAKTRAIPLAGQVLGTAGTALTIAQAEYPWGESTAGNWLCDVMKAKVNADFAFINSGAIRVNIPRGDVTMGELYTFLPFGDFIMTADLTGAQIKALLEQAVGDGGKGIQTAGLTFAYNPGAPGGSRIESISKSDGTPVDMADTARTYRVAVNDYVAAGGDGFSVCKTIKFSGTHILLRDALAENIRQTGHITAKIEGRIKNVQNTGYITRAEFAGLLTRALDLAGDESAAGFSDVFPGQQFAGVIGAAAKAGLVCGYEDGSFRPGYPVSREEMTVMAVRAVQAAGFTAETSNVNAAIARFYDQDEISGWARIPVAAAVEAGIVCGRQSDYFDPSGHVTRAEAAAVLERALDYINR